MGVDSPSLAILSAAKSLGVDFRSTMMVGRQNFYGAGVESALRALFSLHQIQADAAEHVKANRFCEPLFKLLGATEVSSLDKSNYQQATNLHDLNLPVPAELHRKFSCVYDGGTIEHVFNCPQAFKNCMEMVCVGGHFVQISAANNFTGHGFWQFSPELIYRVLSPQNGFRITTVLMHEVEKGGRWFVVRDPQAVGGRVELCNRAPTYILTIAKRVNDGPILTAAPQQSDYVEEWSRGAKPALRRVRPAAIRSLDRLLPVPVKTAIKSMFPRLVTFREPQYRHVSQADVMSGRNLSA
jgi:hypothetical protein